MSQPSRGQSTQPHMTERIKRFVCLSRFATTAIPWYKRVLDYGAGNGLVADAIQVGIYNLVDRLDIGTPRPPRAFDIIYCFDVIEHTHAGEDILADIHSLMDEHGILVMTLPNRWWIFETHARWPFNRLPGFNWGPWRHWLRRKVGRSVPCYTLDESVLMVEQEGFNVFRKGYLGAPLDMLPILRGVIPERTLYRFLATDIWIIARKAKRQAAPEDGQQEGMVNAGESLAGLRSTTRTPPRGSRISLRSL